MRTYTIEEIRKCFTSSEDFNELFDAFEAAIALEVKDFEPYRPLFWNHSLTPDEVRLFGEKLAAEFPGMAYDVFRWLASVFEVTQSTNDNFELTFHYLQKAANARPEELDSYLDACDCYDPDLNIPSLRMTIEFVKQGVHHVRRPSLLYKRLARLHELAGEYELADQCRRKAGLLDTPPPEKPAAP